MYYYYYYYYSAPPSPSLPSPSTPSYREAAPWNQEGRLEERFKSSLWTWGITTSRRRPRRHWFLTILISDRGKTHMTAIIRPISIFVGLYRRKTLVGLWLFRCLSVTSTSTTTRKRRTNVGTTQKNPSHPLVASCQRSSFNVQYQSQMVQSCKENPHTHTHTYFIFIQFCVSVTTTYLANDFWTVTLLLL